MLEPVQVEAYGTHMPLNQLATVSVPEPRLLSVQVWDKSMVHAVEKAIVNCQSRPEPSTEGQVLRLRIPELNEERRKEMVKVAHKYAENARVAVRHVRRDGLELLKKLEKDHKISEDDHDASWPPRCRRRPTQIIRSRSAARRQGKGNHDGLSSSHEIGAKDGRSRGNTADTA